MENCSVMFIHQEVFESIVIMRNANRIKRNAWAPTLVGKFGGKGDLNNHNRRFVKKVLLFC